MENEIIPINLDHALLLTSVHLEDPSGKVKINTLKPLIRWVAAKISHWN